MKNTLLAPTLAVLTPLLALAADPSNETPASSLPDDPAAMMQMWAQINAKGQPHADFQKIVGTWNAREKHFMGSETFDGEGTSKLHTILDGRYLVQEYKSKSQFGEFEGLGITAYDNIKKQYTMVWMDTMSTGILTSHGQKDGDTITFRGRQPMPDGSTTRSRMEFEIVNNDKIVLTMFGQMAPDQDFQKHMQVTYTRAR